MRGHDQSDVRRRHVIILWLLVAVSLAIASPSGSQAQEQSSAKPSRITANPRWNGDPVEPIQLSADHVQTWTDQGAEWVLLEDQAGIAQGDVSLRADKLLARIVRETSNDATTFLLEIYAEGNVRDPGSPEKTYREIRSKLQTVKQINLSARVPGGQHALNKPPRGVPILARAFPKDKDKEKDEANPPRETAARLPVPVPVPVPTPSPTPTPSIPQGPTTVTVGSPFGAKELPVLPVEPATKVQDAAVMPVQTVEGQGFPGGFSATPRVDQFPLPAAPASDPMLPLVPNDVPFGPGSAPLVIDPPTGLQPLPDGSPRPVRPIPGPTGGDNESAPVLPGSQRVTQIFPRGLGAIEFESKPVLPDGTQIIVVRNGVNIQTVNKEQGIVDIEADSVVIFRRNQKDNPSRMDTNGKFVDGKNDPLEFYLEGHVIFKQDQQIYQGKSDQRTYQAERVYYDVQKDQLLALNAQLELFAPGLVTPAKMNSPRIFQYHPLKTAPNGQIYASTLPAIQTDKTVTTGSRFANPGYRFTSKSLDIERVVDNRVLADNSGKPFTNDDLTWLIDARNNFFFFGPVPVFYFPRLVVEADDLNPPLQSVTFSTNNYFGQQFRSSYDVFNLLQKRHLPEIDAWTLDIDYLSARDKRFGQGNAVGTELGWFGQDLINDIKDPFHKDKSLQPSRLTTYAGYFDIFGLFDGSRDVLGPGLAVITNGPNNNLAGRQGYSRFSNPTFQEFRGRATVRHMQSFLPKDAPLDEDFRVNFEFGISSDRNFLEQYYKRLFDTGIDQENLLYAIRQKQNRAFTVLTETNLQTFNTETQWYPKGDYYRLGDSFLDNRLTYFQHTGADYANVHTAAEVNNRTIFAYLPTDPVSNTNGTFQSGRAYTAHELDLPLDFKFLRVTPYVQGQAVGWNNQIGGHAVGRLWGAVGFRADMILWKAYPNAESEILNVHGLNHKIDFVVDARDAYSSVTLNSLGVQDDLDDNSYEYTRRYFALTNYGGGILPAQYDPRLLILRRGLSPITGTTDIQASVETIKLGIHQRLQTKRGQEGRRHINDYMVFDLDTTYFPQASRDNFGKPFGQNFYNYEWYIGDRTSIISYGWFEFWKVTGDPYFQNNNLLKNDPFGLHIVTSGLSITRIPKGNIFIGYTIVNTGPISTSALNASYSYWMTPKWFGTAGTSYDFGNGLLLGASGSLTRIGADYLTSVGLTASPLQHSYQFTFEISPRLSPNIRTGSASGLARPNAQYAPVE